MPELKSWLARQEQQPHKSNQQERGGFEHRMFFELALEYFADGARIPSGVKFGGIFTIVAVSLFYEQLARLKPPA